MFGIIGTSSRLNLLVVASLFWLPVALSETCPSNLVEEFNQSLQTEAVELKSFLEGRKQSRLSARERVEACSRWSVMQAYADSMLKHSGGAGSGHSGKMVAHLKSDLDGNNDCWTNSKVQLANMLDGVRLIIARSIRLGDLLNERNVPEPEENRSPASEP